MLRTLETAVVRCEEGGDDVKSARPLRPPTRVTMGYRRQLHGDVDVIPKASQFGLESATLTP